MMTTDSIFEKNRLIRAEFPEVDEIRASTEGGDPFQVALEEKYQLTQQAMEEMKQLPSDISKDFWGVLKKVKSELSDHFQDDEAWNIKTSAGQVTHAVTSLFRGSADELIKIKGGGDDLVFLLQRSVQYRCGLLSLVSLVDPIDFQEENLGNAVLIYEDMDGREYACHVKVPKILDARVTEPTGVSFEEINSPCKKDFYDLILHMYHGADGILERKNVLKVEAPGRYVEPKQILNKAASLYRDAYKDDEDIFSKS
jgi:hypothetical protein